MQQKNRARQHQGTQPVRRQNPAEGGRRSFDRPSLGEAVALRNSLFNPLNPVLEKLLLLDKLRELYASVRQPDDSNIFNRILKQMNVACSVTEADLARVPAAGSTVVVANHPFGILDGILLGALLLKVRPDLKILTNYMLTGVPELDEYCVPLDPFAADNSNPGMLQGVNQRGLRGAVDWLRSGGMLLIFPAGEVAHLQWAKGVTDPKWNTTAFRLARMTGAPVLPMYIDGRNSVPFQLVGFVHPRLRTARLPREFLQKRGAKVEVRIGSKIPANSFRLPAKEDNCALKAGNTMGTAWDGTEFLRWKTYMLANRTTNGDGRVPKRHSIAFLPAKLPLMPFPPAPEELADFVPNAILAREVAQLPPSSCLENSEEYAVYCAQAAEIPQLMREIGRLRELTFREVGEGTGKSVDLDRFDAYYSHLILWSKVQNEIVGAYRLAKTAEILPKFGINGLYTNTLFRYKRDFFTQLGNAIELGRSFVRPEYQRQYAPLLLLWKAIGRYVALNPAHPVLFGAVSISNSYAPASRALMYHFFRAQFAAHPLSGMVQPRRPFRSGRLKYSDIRAFNRLVRDAEDLSGSVSDCELDGKGIPVLLKQYLKVGGQVLAFNVDGRFSDTLDGLIVVDLRRTDRKNLQKYLGNDGAAAFLQHHQADECAQTIQDLVDVR
ncbi:MAG TPA: GNAT family N-acyltransferase [Terriglobales bacterium]|nr:GNAT family N-acyltransferase [Terriglobales bacterium]